MRIAHFLVLAAFVNKYIYMYLYCVGHYSHSDTCDSLPNDHMPRFTSGYLPPACMSKTFGQGCRLFVATALFAAHLCQYFAYFIIFAFLLLSFFCFSIKNVAASHQIFRNSFNRMDFQKISNNFKCIAFFKTWD